MQSTAILDFFSKYINSQLGIVYDENNYFQLLNRLEEIAKALGKNNLETLYQDAQSGIEGKLKQALLDSATNNETSFFRDEKVFQAIESHVLKSAVQKSIDGHPFRIWSAACSTGQEAISLAILIREYAEKSKTMIRFKILGTDISQRVLSKATEGAYSPLEVNRGLSEKLKTKYFSLDSKENWVRNAELKADIEFKSLNLKESFSFPEDFHLILCRNVLIYQDVDGKTKILRKITNSLAVGGFLILGSGESLFGLSEDYEQLFIDGAVLYQKK